MTDDDLKDRIRGWDISPYAVYFLFNVAGVMIRWGFACNFLQVFIASFEPKLNLFFFILVKLLFSYLLFSFYASFLQIILYFLIFVLEACNVSSFHPTQMKKGETHIIIFFFCLHLFHLLMFPQSLWIVLLLVIVIYVSLMNADIWFLPRMQHQRHPKMFLTFCIWLISLLSVHIVSSF